MRLANKMILIGVMILDIVSINHLRDSFFLGDYGLKNGMIFINLGLDGFFIKGGN